ncbi:MAG TPA: hypothetical protein VKZ56_00925 [Membranihabitans sp.]|nr:hypothetical protein [Membranihabitans sp.]
MKHIRIILIFSLWVWTMGGSYAQDESSHIFKAGFAERDITPDIGMEQPGGYGKSYHTQFNDRCKVRAAVFDDGQKRVAIVGVDILFITRDVVMAAREGIRELCGIDPQAVMIGASHSHSSGPIGMTDPSLFEDASPLIKELVFEKSITSDPGYIQHLTHQIIQAVVQADRIKVDAKLAVGVGHEDKVSFNRRLRMKNGLTFSHPGVGNPDIIDYAGPIDPDVGTVGVWDHSGQLLGTIVNFSCHATTNPGGISANWIGTMEETLRRATGNAALPVVFLQGACGDITQVDNLAEHANPSGREWCEIVGGRVGAEAFKTLLLVRRGAGNNIPLNYTSRVWEIERRKPSSERVRDAMDIVVQKPEEVGTTAWTFAKSTVILDALIEKSPTAEVEVQVIQVGPIALVSNPAEYFVEFGLDIKKGVNFPFTFVVELANGCVGYVPTEEAFSKNGGGYETRLTEYSNLAVTAGQQFAETGIRLANSLEPGPVPEPPLPPEFKSPWSYGNVPPELD